MTALSMVVRCFNEEACLSELYRRLTSAARTAVADDYELVLINDGSRYFGPYTDVSQMRRAPNVVKRIFTVRSCNYDLPTVAPVVKCAYPEQQDGAA